MVCQSSPITVSFTNRRDGTKNTNLKVSDGVKAGPSKGLVCSVRTLACRATRSQDPGASFVEPSKFAFILGTSGHVVEGVMLQGISIVGGVHGGHLLCAPRVRERCANEARKSHSWKKERTTRHE